MDYLKKIESQLDLSNAEREQVMRELKSHFEELKEDLIASGMTRNEARREAAKRIGDTSDVAARLSAVHNSSSWKSALLAAVPFIFSAIFILGVHHITSIVMKIAAVSVLAAVMLLGSIPALIRGRMPYWTAAWLGGGLTAVFAIIGYLTPLIISGTRVPSGLISVEIAAFAIAVVTPIVAWRVIKRRKVAIIVSIICMIDSIYMISSGPSGSSIVPFIIGLLLALGLLIHFARSVFEEHSHGNALNASLFLFAAFGTQFFITPVIYLNASPTRHWLAIECLCAVAVVWFARAPQLRGKIRAIMVGTLFLSLGSAISERQTIYLLISIFFQWMIFCGIVLYPLWRRSIRSEEGPQIVV